MKDSDKIIENNFFNELQKSNLKVNNNCIELINEIKKSVSGSLEYTEIKMIDNSKIENKLKIENYMQVYEYYIKNQDESAKIPTKNETARYFNSNETMIKRINTKLKDENKIYTQGRFMYLNIEEGVK